MTDAPLCQDCAHQTDAFMGNRYACCKKSKLCPAENVYENCFRFREKGRECGPEGRLFEKRLSAWRRLIERIIP